MAEIEEGDHEEARRLAEWYAKAGVWSDPNGSPMNLARCYLDALAERDGLILWMERGCPVFLHEDDDIARPLGNARLAVQSYKRGLAAIDGIEQYRSVWRRKKA